MEGYTSFQFMIIEFDSDGSGYEARAGDIEVIRNADN